MGTKPSKYYCYYVLLVFFTGNLSYQGVTDSAFPAHLEAKGSRYPASELLQVFHGLARVGKDSRKSLQGRPRSSECEWANSHHYTELMKVLCDGLASRPGSWHLRPELVEPSSLSDATWLTEKQARSGSFNRAWILGPSIAWQAPGSACRMWEGAQSALSFPQSFSLPLSSPPLPRELVRNPSIMD